MSGAKVFLDTDVILDFVLRRGEFFHDAAILLQAGMDGKVHLMASAGSLKDVFYFARKAPGNEQKGRETVRLLLQVVEVCAVARAMWEDALVSPCKDTEDALQLACATRNGANFLVTRNAKDYAAVASPQIVQPDVLVVLIRSGVS